MTMRKITELKGVGVEGVEQPLPGQARFRLDNGDLTAPITLPVGETGRGVAAISEVDETGHAHVEYTDGSSYSVPVRVNAALLDANAVRSAGPFSSTKVYEQGSVVFHDGAVWWAQPTDAEPEVSVRRNYVPSPLFNPAGWVTVSGRSTLTKVDAGGQVDVSSDTAPGNQIISSLIGAVPAGTDAWSASVRVTVPTGYPAVSLRVSAGFGPVTQASPATVVQTVRPGESLVIVQQGNSAPAGKDSVELRVGAGATAVPAGARFILSEPVLSVGTTVGEFFHGSMGDIKEADKTVTYSWEGAEDYSTSVETTTRGQTIGTPGVSPVWVRLWDDPNATARPIPTLQAARTTAIKPVPRWMDSTRLKVWGRSGGSLLESTDDGSTWTTVHTWDNATVAQMVREFANGELMVDVTPTTTGAPSEIWVSQGYPTGDATWTKVIQPTVNNVRFPSAWSVYVHGRIGLVGEYGPKEGSTGGAVGSGEYARLVRLTIDNGKTWKVILDLDDLKTGSSRGLHLHGVAWDPWWDRIWVTWGDDQNGTAFSDDLGATWHHAQYDATVAGSHQNVGILPMRDVILFGSDIAPNGVHRITRDQGKHSGEYTIDIAHRIDNESVRTALCHGLFQVSPEHVAFIAFGSETNPASSKIIATRDGKTFTQVWEDSAIQPPGRGLRSVIGPTARGNLIAEFVDVDDGGTSIIIGPAPY